MTSAFRASWFMTGVPENPVSLSFRRKGTQAIPSNYTLSNGVLPELLQDCETLRSESFYVMWRQRTLISKPLHFQLVSVPNLCLGQKKSLFNRLRKERGISHCFHPRPFQVTHSAGRVQFVRRNLAKNPRKAVIGGRRSSPRLGLLSLLLLSRSSLH